MDSSWWPAVAAVVALAVIAGLVDSFGRVRRAHRRPGAAPGPRPGEVWWAGFPYEDEAGEGDGGGDGDEDTGGDTYDGAARPCLVLRTAGPTVTVAPVTTRPGDGRPGVIPLPPGTVDDEDRPRFLDTDELREIGLRDLRRRSGPVDPAVWEQVRHLADI